MPRASSREEIRRAFTQRVAENGYEGTNFGSIADELGISKGTIVHHFGTKERLFADVHERYMAQRLAEARALVKLLATPEQRLAGLIWTFAMYQTYGRTETVAFQREIVRFSGSPSMRHSRALRDEYRDLVKSILRQGIDDGAFHPGNVSIWALQIFGGTQWMWTWFDPDGTVSNDDVARSYVELIARGLLTDPNRVAPLVDPNGPVRRAVYQVLDAD
ncbi:fatty acid metabolism transcriptional regulator FadR [Gordonia sinesedis]